MQVDGKPRALSLDPRTTVLDALREHLVVTAPKKAAARASAAPAPASSTGGGRRRASLAVAYDVAARIASREDGDRVCVT